MELKKASPEQELIVNFSASYNVVVDSVAGSGKTTTVLHIAQNQPLSNILLLTYNKKLRLETRSKQEALNITNLEVHTYHSFCRKYYDNTCQSDTEIINVLSRRAKRLKLFSYDLIILDESQDITPVYYELVHKIHSDTHPIMPRLCILGDRYQSIYDYNKADARFIVYAKSLFSINKYSWKTTKLSTTFRLTNQMADFMNKCVLKYNRLTALKQGTKPRYIICDCFDEDGRSTTVSEVNNYLSHYPCEDIFILAPSVKSEGTPVRKLANKISQLGTKIYVPGSDEEKLDEDILKGKLVFSTFHQAKGLERKVVLLFGFDDSYFKYYKQNADPQVCPNELYVALTRASEKLTIFHHYTNDHLQFLEEPLLKTHTDYKVDNTYTFNFKKQNTHNQGTPKPPETAVTDLLRHLPTDVIIEATKFFTIEQIDQPSTIIDIPIKTQQNDSLFESVSEITGVAIPAYFELLHKGEMTIYKELNKRIDYEKIETSRKRNTTYMFGTITTNSDPPTTTLNMTDIDLSRLKPEELLYIANEYCCFKSGYVFKKNQIQHYDWLTEDNLKLSVKRLSTKYPNMLNMKKKSKYPVKRKR